MPGRIDGRCLRIPSRWRHLAEGVADITSVLLALMAETNDQRVILYTRVFGRRTSGQTRTCLRPHAVIRNSALSAVS